MDKDNIGKSTILIVSEEEHSPIPLRYRENRAEQIAFFSETRNCMQKAGWTDEAFHRAWRINKELRGE